MRIRLATFEDVPQLVAMGERFYRRAEHATLADYDAGSAARSASHVIAHGFLFVAEVDGKLAGMLGMIVAPFMLNLSKLTATEVMWWVEEGARGVGGLLLRRVIREARARGCAWCSMSTLASSPPEAAELLACMGFRHIESTYLLEL